MMAAKVEMAMAGFKSLLPNVQLVADFGSNRQHPGAASVMHKTESQRLTSEAGVGGHFSGKRATSVSPHSCLHSEVRSWKRGVPVLSGPSGDSQEVFEWRVG